MKVLRASAIKEVQARYVGVERVGPKICVGRKIAVG